EQCCTVARKCEIEDGEEGEDARDKTGPFVYAVCVPRVENRSQDRLADEALSSSHPDCACVLCSIFMERLYKG
ncbi:hypothetical protein, partial [Escherichia coli]|uniref:hypothetical protein n=1 Tax=Escherichia coli TaxID=562 RepID=UPI001F2F5080